MSTSTPTVSPTFSQDTYDDILDPIWLALEVFVLILVISFLLQRCCHVRNVAVVNKFTNEYLGEKMRELYERKRAEMDPLSTSRKR